MIKKEMKKKTKKEVCSNVELIKSSNDNKKIENNYAGFYERLGAFIIDSMIILLILNFIVLPFGNSNNYKKLSKEADELISEYSEGKIEIKEYSEKAKSISYQMSKEMGLITILEIAITVLYFVVYQFKKRGQTIGKMLLKIRVVGNDNNELSINTFLFRSLFINFVLVDTIVLCLALFTNKNIYFNGTYIVQIINYIFVFVSMILIVFRKDKRGLHDLIVNTKVIKEKKLVEEFEVCEN